MVKVNLGKNVKRKIMHYSLIHMFKLLYWKAMWYCKKSTKYLVRKTCLHSCSITHQPGRLRLITLPF